MRIQAFACTSRPTGPIEKLFTGSDLGSLFLSGLLHKPGQLRQVGKCMGQKFRLAINHMALMITRFELIWKRMACTISMEGQVVQLIIGVRAAIEDRSIIAPHLTNGGRILNATIGRTRFSFNLSSNKLMTSSEATILC